MEVVRPRAGTAEPAQHHQPVGGAGEPGGGRVRSGLSLLPLVPGLLLHRAQPPAHHCPARLAAAQPRLGGRGRGREQPEPLGQSHQWGTEKIRSFKLLELVIDLRPASEGAFHINLYNTVHIILANETFNQSQKIICFTKHYLSTSLKYLISNVDMLRVNFHENRLSNLFYKRQM